MDSSCYKNDRESGKLVVAKTSVNPNNPFSLSVTTDFTDTVPIELMFYKQDSYLPEHLPRETTATYAILETRHATHCLNVSKHLEICSNGLINKISLIDFPFGQYILSCNGSNLGTAKFNKRLVHYEFDLASDTSEYLKIYKDIAVGADEPAIDDRKSYLNIGRIDTIHIHKPNNLELGRKHMIKLHGYFKINGEWMLGEKDIPIYPKNTHNFHTSGEPTESLDLGIEGTGTIIVMIDGDVYAEFTCNTDRVRIKINNPNQVYMHEHKYLPQEIIKTVVGIYHIQFITLGCQIRSIDQNHYKIYTYPHRLALR